MRRHHTLLPPFPPACRLGLATRGNTHLACEEVLFAFEQGVNYWNWCGHADGMSQAVAELGTRRDRVVLATQVSADGWSRDAMWRTLERTLQQLQTPWLDVATLYYVESDAEWRQIIDSDGALRALQEAKEQGIVRAIGLTSHQRPLAAAWVESGLLDLLMIRYNAAHRGAEQEVFPVTDRLNVPVIAFTCLRWGKLLQPTPRDPPDFLPPTARDCYRFVLSNPSVAVALMAPDDGTELRHNLRLLTDWQGLTEAARQAMIRHGDRVRATAGRFD